MNVFPGFGSLVARIAERPWVTLVELLLIWTVVFVILRFFRGTRGARLVRAVLSILVVSFAVVWLIAEQMESERIKVLYPYFILGVFLVSLVAFQTELRRILLKLGEGSWWQSLIRPVTEAVDPIVTAVERLSKKKIGALIAVERMGEIIAVVESGIRIDSLVTPELLETIFWPGTPLHDLGVVIHQGRIQAAGCQFPLAESGEVDRSLGSRHRAGIGMSQEAESVVIIVSEETGAISVAMRGRLQRGLTPASLRDLLIHELTREDAKSDDVQEAVRGEPATTVQPTESSSAPTPRDDGASLSHPNRVTADQAVSDPLTPADPIPVRSPEPQTS